MCGIVGVLNLTTPNGIDEIRLRQMLALIRHRGPDQFGIYRDSHVGLGSARLSIIDLSTGQQPIANEDRSQWIVFNGEVFNYVELRPALEARGHQFETTSDTEVILHLYEDYGPDCLQYLNGQFAIAIWDAREQALFLARDRVGIRPLYYTVAGDTLIFGSEIKAILADPRVTAEIDPEALNQIFTFWSTLSPRTVYKGIQEVPPGHYLIARDGEITIKPYWTLRFPPDGGHSTADLDALLEEFRELLVDSTRIRLRADVPVGAYLSGGLDSSATSAIIRNYTSNHLDTFSIAFSDPDYDESVYQQQMARFLGTDHQVVQVTHEDIGRVFPDVIWHAEVPVMRTSPAPMFLLSKLVQDNNFKVVLTGEGADEFLGGYNIFKEAKIRRFWARQPDSQIRPLLLKRLYPYIGDLTSSGSAYLMAFFQQGLTDVEADDYSHALRWRTTSRTRRFFSNDLKQALGGSQPEATLAYPPEFVEWSPLNQAQYLEATIFMSQYLLSSQGDRMGMAHSVEGRFPFLDYRLIEFANRLPARYKLRGLNEKYLLKRLASRWIPDEIWRRPKRPYRAPIHRSFFNERTPAYVRELLSPEGISAAGYFNPAAVSQMVRKIEQGVHTGETDDMALAGILSTQLVHQQFVADFKMPPPLSEADDVKVCVGQPL
ncbi:MAG: asparagine synthase (glutamine-hydrolyzing) [Anaerolineae bacterium]|nr:asparagine synthase (glutamine-hydrolyzing) [Anaerolineae bacterium]